MARLSAPPDKFSQGWLHSLDGRTTIAQIMAERWQSFTDDLGGADSLSYAQRSLVERALFLEFWLKQQEQELAAGREVDMGRYTQSVNSYQGLLIKLGLDRQSKNIPDLASFLKAKGKP